MKALFITLEELKRKSIIDGNVDTDKLIQFVEVAQDTYIQTQLGTKLYDKQQDGVINNNLNGTFNMSHACANKFFIPQKKGNIVNITANVLRGFPGMAHTGAARAGVENLTKTLGQEWAEYKIRINAIAPGIIATSGLDSYPEVIKSFFKKIEKKNLMNRFGTPKDIANAVIFLASPLSSYISGITIPVDGLEHLSGDRMELFNMIKKLI